MYVDNWQAVVVDKTSIGTKLYDANNRKIFIKNDFFELGQHVVCQKAVLSPMHRLKNPQDFNSTQPLYLAKVAGCKLVVGFLDVQRQKIRSSLSSLSNTLQLNVVKSLVVGGSSQLTKLQYLVLKKTATLHLIAISGLHIGLLISWSRFFLRCLLSRLLFGSLFGGIFVDGLSFALALNYGLLIHLPLSAQRALLMCLIVIVMQWARWYRSKLFVLFVACYVLLLFSPEAAFQPSFWLSFLGVLLLLLGSDSQHAVKNYLVVFLGTSVVCMFFFNTLAWSGVLANIVAIPVFSIWIVPLSMLGTVVVNFSTVLANLLWVLSSFGFAVIWPVLNLLSECVVLRVMHVDFIHYVVSFFGVLGFAFFANWSFVIWVLHLFYCAKFAQGFLLTVLDVGQGLAVVVQTKHHVLIYDTGLKYKDYNSGEKVIEPFLNYKGIAAIDGLIISHGDIDHSGGAKYLIDNFPVKRVLSSEPNRLSFAAEYCYAGQHWVWDGVEFAVLSPPVGSKWQGNKGSCVLMISSRKKRLLLAGDVDAEVEQWLVKKYRLQAEGLVVPHHGSKTSSSNAFLNAISPKWAIISSGKNNRFKLPNKDVVNRYLRREINLFDTQQDGAVSVYFD